MLVKEPEGVDLAGWVSLQHPHPRFC